MMVDGGIAVEQSATCDPPSAVSFAGTYESLRPIQLLHKKHDDRLAVIVGSGASLSDFNFAQLRREWIFSMAINCEPFKKPAREQYTPNAWIFFDWGPYENHCGAKQCVVCNAPKEMQPHPETLILTRGGIIQQAFACVQHERPERRVPITPWLHRVHAFDGNRGWSNPEAPDGVYFMSKTTATAAICACVAMGFKAIALLGIDLYCTGTSYYHLGRKHHAPNMRGAMQMGEGRFATDGHIRMLGDFTAVKTRLDQARWPGKIWQTSLLSPLSVFEKLRWEGVVHQFGR